MIGGIAGGAAVGIAASQPRYEEDFTVYHPDGRVTVHRHRKAAGGSLTCLMVLAIILLLVYAPWGVVQRTPVHNGDSIIMARGSTWYTTAEIFAWDNVPYGKALLYKTCPERATVTRDVVRKVDVDISSVEEDYFEEYWMNINSSAAVAWDLTSPAYFMVKERTSTGISVYSTSSSSSSSTATISRASLPYSQLYVFQWLRPYYTTSSINGSATIAFSLSAFDPSLADKTCTLTTDKPCKFDLTSESCVVFDNYDGDELSVSVNEEPAIIEGKTSGSVAFYFFVFIGLPLLVIGACCGAYFYVFHWRKPVGEPEFIGTGNDLGFDDDDDKF